MIISKQMNDAINEQIGNEFNGSLQYVGIATYFDLESLPELAKHFYAQSSEEHSHAMRFVKYLVDAGAPVCIPAIPEGRGTYHSAEEAVRTALESEQEVTRQINGLVDLAIKESDHITNSVLQWFVTEQLEELSSMETLLKVIERAGPQGLLHVEDFLARRRPQHAADAMAASLNG